MTYTRARARKSLIYFCKGNLISMGINSQASQVFITK